MIRGIKPKLAVAGNIKIGGLGEARDKRGGGTFRLPIKLDHFLVTTTNRTKAGDLEVDLDLMGELGADSDGQVRSIPIVLHSDEIDEVFPTAYALYSGRRCACRGDGETAFRREVKGKQYTGEEGIVKCPCRYLKAETAPICKPNGKLFCSIDVPNAAIAGAVHAWRTTSMISIEQMIGSLLQIKAVCGTLRGVPLWLKVKPIVVQPPGMDTAITVYCCHIELRASDIREIQREALDAAKRRHELGLNDSEYGKMLTLPAHGETTDEESEIANEFYPEDSSNVNGEGEAPLAEVTSPVDAPTEKPSTDTASPQSVAERMAQEAAEKAGAKEPEPVTAKTEVVTKPAAREPEPGEIQSGSEMAPKMVELILGRLRNTYKMSDEQIKLALGGPIDGAPLEELQRVIDDCEKHFLNQKQRGDSAEGQLDLEPQGQTKEEKEEEDDKPPIDAEDF